MPGEPSIFMQSVASRHDMFPGSKVGMSPDLNIQGIPGLSGPEGALATMFAEPILKNMLGPGFIPGQFQQTHNLYDHYRKKQQFQSMQAVMGQAAEADQTQYTSLLRGMASTAGVQWTDEKERAARMMAQDMSKISPMLAQAMPDTFDQMHGSRGSAALMAQGMFQGGRYRLDPVTRMLGQSADSTSQMTKEMYERLYGPGADLSEMKGLGAGRSGQMFDEMSRRGMLPRVMSRDEQMQGVARRDLKAKGVGEDKIEEQMGTALDELRNLSSPQLEMKVRQFEAGRVGDRIKSMAGAVAAMKDVFGEMGRPDAPMNELIEGLQVITQGGLANMTPDRVEGLVRDASNVARRSGVGMDNMTMLMATAAQRADGMGLDRTFGVTAGLQAAAFGSAYANTTGGSPAWGRADKERMTAVDSNLRLNAANSSVANQLAATVRLGQDVGFKADTEAAALYQAVQAGETTYEFGGKKKSVHAQAGEWRAMMEKAGVDSGTASAYRGQTAYNQKTVDEANLTGLSRQLQADVDVAPRLDRAFQRAAQTAGFDRATMTKLGKAGQEGLLDGIAPEDLQDKKKVAEFLADRAGIDKGDPEQMAKLERVATMGWGNVEQMVKLNPRLRGYKTADQLVAAHRRGTTQETVNQVDEARQESRLQSALAGLGSGSPLTRLMDAVAGATDKTEIKDIVKSTLGWTPEGEVGKRLEGTVQQMQAEIAKFRDTDPEKLGREARDLDASRRGHAQKAEGLRKRAEELAGASGSAAARVMPEAAQREMAALQTEGESAAADGQAAIKELDQIAKQAGTDKFDLLRGGFGPKAAREEGRRLRDRAAEILKSGQPGAEELNRLKAQSGGLLDFHRDDKTGEYRVTARDGANADQRRRAEEIAGQLTEKEREATGVNRQLHELALRHTGGSVGALVAEAVPDDIRQEARTKRDEIVEAGGHIKNADLQIRQIAKEKYGNDSDESIRRVRAGEGLTDPQLDRLRSAVDANNAFGDKAKGNIERLRELTRVHGFGSETLLYGDPDPATKERAQGLQRQVEQAEKEGKPEQVAALKGQLQSLANEKTGGNVEVATGQKTALEAFTGGREVAPDVRAKVDALRDRVAAGRERVLAAQKRMVELTKEHGAIREMPADARAKVDDERQRVEVERAVVVDREQKLGEIARQKGVTVSDLVAAVPVAKEDREAATRLETKRAALLGQNTDQGRAEAGAVGQQLQELANAKAGGSVDVLLGKAKPALALDRTTGDKVKALAGELAGARDRVKAGEGRIAEAAERYGIRPEGIQAVLDDPAVPPEKKAELRQVQEQLQREQAGAAGDRQKMQELADKYTGGNVEVLLNSKNLQKTIREHALVKIRSFSPELRRQAEQAGLELGATATSEDAAGAWRALRDKRGAAGTTESDVLAEKMLHDDRSMSVLGPGGLDMVRRIQGRNRDLRALADRAGVDMGVLMATDDQRKRAREQLGIVTKGAADVTRLEREVQDLEGKGDIDGANKKREDLEKAKKVVTDAQGALETVGKEAGTTGEKLARAPGVEDKVRVEADRLRTDQMKDVSEVQTKLKESRRHPLSDDDKKALETERGSRRASESQVVRDIFQTLGVSGASAKDREEMAKEVRGDRGAAIRAALPSLQKLRELKKDMSGDQFQDYLRKGLDDKATDEEKALYHKVSGGKAGGGLAGLGRDTTRPDQVRERLREFAPGQRDQPPGGPARPDARATAATGPMEITGKLTIEGLGEARVQARGGRA